MANRSSVNATLLAAAVNCFFLLCIFLTPRFASTEDNTSGLHHSSLSTGDDDVGGSSQVGGKNPAVGQDVSSVLVEEDHYSRQRDTEKDWESHGYQRSTGQSSTGRSPQRERSTRGSSLKKTAATASRIFLTSALITVAVLLSWQLGNLFVKCLTRARALTRAAGSSPRSLSDPESGTPDWDTLCEGVYSSTGVALGDHIPLVGTPQGTHSDEDSEDETSLSTLRGLDAEGGSGGYVQSEQERRRLTRTWKMILIVWIPLITVVFGVLVWLLVYHSRSQVKSTTTAPSGYNHLTTSALHGQSASVLYQLNAPVPPENATLSSQTGTPGPVPSSVPPTTSSSSSHISTARPSTESPLKSSSEGKPSTSTAGSTRTSPTPSEPSSPSLGRLSAPTLAASSPASSPPTTSTSLPSAASSSAAVGPSSARESGLSTPPSSDTSPSTSPGENSSPVPETSFPAPAGTASPSSDAASDVLSPTSLSTGASATAVHTTISTPAPRPKWQRNHVWVDCTVKKLHNKDTCYAKIYYFPWRAVYPHIIYGNTVYVFDLKRGQVAKLKEKNLYVPVLEELAKQIKHRRQELLHEGQSADRFRINLRSYLADLEHL